MPEISVKTVRKLLMNEYQQRLDTALLVLRHGALPNGEWGVNLNEYFDDALRAVVKEIEAIQTFEQAETFVHAHYHMSLQEWIDSL